MHSKFYVIKVVGVMLSHLISREILYTMDVNIL